MLDKLSGLLLMRELVWVSGHRASEFPNWEISKIGWFFVNICDAEVSYWRIVPGLITEGRSLDQEERGGNRSNGYINPL
jgi:hypothetical protein